MAEIHLPLVYQVLLVVPTVAAIVLVPLGVLLVWKLDRHDRWAREQREAERGQ